MMYAQYCRIETKAGGCHASPRALIRAARSVLAKHAKTRPYREVRHAWLREVLAQHREAQIEYMSVMSGRRRK